jgi:hypothetical protein
MNEDDSRLTAAVTADGDRSAPIGHRVGDRRRQVTERVAVTRGRATVSGQIGRDPAARPLTGQQLDETVPDVAGGGQSVKQ